MFLCFLLTGKQSLVSLKVYSLQKVSSCFSLLPLKYGVITLVVSVLIGGLLHSVPLPFGGLSHHTRTFPWLLANILYSADPFHKALRGGLVIQTFRWEILLPKKKQTFQCIQIYQAKTEKKGLKVSANSRLT